MSAFFEEIDYRPTPIGPISLRRRRILALDQDVYEIILGDEHLMSSLFTASEIALSRLGLAVVDGNQLEVVVGGLGLGYTAGAVLEDERVSSLTVVEFLEAVIDWHHEKLLPLDPPVVESSRCCIRQGDFFALAVSHEGFDRAVPGRTFDVILIDIDHGPDWLLNERSGSFYTEEGLRKFTRHLKPGGVMGLWSDSGEDPAFTARLGTVFAKAWAEPVTFHNPLQDKSFTQTIYLAQKKGR